MIGRKETAKRDTATSLGDKDTASKGRIGKKTSPNWDSDTELGRDMKPAWENTEYLANSGRQQMVVRQTETPMVQITPTQRQVYTVDCDDIPATPARLRGMIVERSATPQQAGATDDRRRNSDSTRPHFNSDSTRPHLNPDHGRAEATAAAATTQLAATGSGATNEPKRDING